VQLTKVASPTVLILLSMHVVLISTIDPSLIDPSFYPYLLRPLSLPHSHFTEPSDTNNACIGGAQRKPPPPPSWIRLPLGPRRPQEKPQAPPSQIWLPSGPRRPLEVHRGSCRRLCRGFGRCWRRLPPPPPFLLYGPKSYRHGGGGGKSGRRCHPLPSSSRGNRRCSTRRCDLHKTRRQWWCGASRWHSDLPSSCGSGTMTVVLRLPVARCGVVTWQCRCCCRSTRHNAGTETWMSATTVPDSEPEVAAAVFF
jgi:hypothetical protein